MLTFIMIWHMPHRQPMQTFLALMKWVFGEDPGYPVYVSTWRQLGMMLLPDEHFWSYLVNKICLFFKKESNKNDFTSNQYCNPS